MINVFLTGATGVMGMAGLDAMTSARLNGEKLCITVLARPGKVNERKLAPYVEKGVRVIWGDLRNAADVKRGVSSADIVLHVGGMVSPAADWYPELTYEVNTTAMRNIVEAAQEKERAGGDVRVVYIGSVSQYGNRAEPHHWGRAGDPIKVATYDMYALSKCEAERMLAESGLKRWVSLRQTGIMYPALLTKASDPITFHVPMRGCLEWITDEESGRLLAAVCSPQLPKKFWNRFYNIGGGESCRLSNYDFCAMTLEAVGCPRPEKAFRLNWFATQNFHGMWYDDSDALEALLHFRNAEGFQAYMDRLRSKLPFYFKLAPLAPAWLIRMVMKRVAGMKKLGPLRWLKENCEPRIEAAWGGREAWESIPGWEEADMSQLSEERILLNHGYDESKPLEELTLEDLQRAAEFRGGRCLAESYTPGDIDEALEWECSEGHRFRLTPRTVLLGGHWCPECLAELSRDPYALRRQAASNRFLAQTL